MFVSSPQCIYMIFIYLQSLFITCIDKATKSGKQGVILFILSWKMFLVKKFDSLSLTAIVNWHTI